MQFDFADVMADKRQMADLAEGVDHDALVAIVDGMFDKLDRVVGEASDADVVFVPRDAAQENPAEPGWTLAHVVVHVTAGLEEAAALGATQARGVEVTGRSRYETPWEELTSADRVRARLAESRRICRAFLAAWPDAPHLEIVDTPVPHFGPLNAVARQLLGVMHASMHEAQIEEIVRQARGEASAVAAP